MQREKIQSNWGKIPWFRLKIGDNFKMMQSQVISHLSSKFAFKPQPFFKTPHRTSLQKPKVLAFVTCCIFT